MKNKTKLYPVYERIFIDGELVEVTNEMWSKVQIIDRIVQMQNNGFRSEYKLSSEGEYLLNFAL